MLLNMTGFADYTIWMLFPLTMFLVGWFGIYTTKIKHMVITLACINFICLTTLIIWAMLKSPYNAFAFAISTVWASTVLITTITMCLNSFIHFKQR
ncbi:hypothetical protein [Bacillus bombysepticus]|uniref:hypothetical protein n=1 Tax=Bacillus bombysepticus TaxID=658666 RepID=UPI003016C4B0